MDHIYEKLFRSNEPNEMLSLKVHYLNFLFNLLNNALQKAKSSTENELDSKEIRKVFHNIIKFWLKPNAKNFPENMERLLRQAIRSYTYQENALFQQLANQSVSKKTIPVFTCSEFDPNKRCSKCKRATYCDERCQRLHWPVHKRVCQEPVESQLLTVDDDKPDLIEPNSCEVDEKCNKDNDDDDDREVKKQNSDEDQENCQPIEQ
ncbi:Ankyrin repeat and MYND domain-containing protein 2 [Dermatophagoides farinae]|uniref:Ankyrin repeat and MYND domain-containing protein 2 n=1 Tax=Dermatophagoides farinae TaxID=6954 RepID=A0A922IH81_DERFA|nr:Ankyrin repeat and MYND domain-containing protein 2 [Dermatophagoides farinae]